MTHCTSHFIWDSGPDLEDIWSGRGEITFMFYPEGPLLPTSLEVISEAGQALLIPLVSSGETEAS